MRRRALETYTVARWAHLRRKSPYAYAKDVIVLGDFNMPAVSSTDPVYRALTRYGLKLPPHSTQIGSAIASDSHYDQVAFFPGETEAEFTGRAGVFDFDGAVFADLWRERTPEDFRRYVRYYLSDHRPLWAEFQT
jgi:endonuclease/exonuclease/phosphatase family metal-dependent hydrolase